MKTFPHREFIRLIREGDPVKIQSRLMSASDKDLALAVTYLSQSERLYVFSRLSPVKAERIKAVLDRGAKFGQEEYRTAVTYLNRHLQSDKPLAPLKSYYRPRKRGES